MLEIVLWMSLTQANNSRRAQFLQGSSAYSDKQLDLTYDSISYNFSQVHKISKVSF